MNDLGELDKCSLKNIILSILDEQSRCAQYKLSLVKKSILRCDNLLIKTISNSTIFIELFILILVIFY